MTCALCGEPVAQRTEEVWLKEAPEWWPNDRPYPTASVDVVITWCAYCDTQTEELK